MDGPRGILLCPEKLLPGEQVMKKKFCLMLAFSALLILSACRGEKLSIDDLLDRGTAAAQNGDWEKAREYAKRAVKLVPSNVNALVLNALALENTGDPDGALDEVSKAVSIDEANYFAQYTKGRLLYEKKKYDSCVAPLRAALTLRPNAPDPLILLAQAAVMLQNDRMSAFTIRVLPVFRSSPGTRFRGASSECIIFFRNAMPRKRKITSIMPTRCAATIRLCS